MEMPGNPGWIEGGELLNDSFDLHERNMSYIGYPNEHPFIMI
jgi:hypothetical protein